MATYRFKRRLSRDGVRDIQFELQGKGYGTVTEEEIRAVRRGVARFRHGGVWTYIGRDLYDAIETALFNCLGG